jgi:hypothetical protein
LSLSTSRAKKTRRFGVATRSSPPEWSATTILVVDVDTISLDEQLHTVGVAFCSSAVESSMTIIGSRMVHTHTSAKC